MRTMKPAFGTSVFRMLTCQLPTKPGWRNWQTQRTQNPPGFGPWGFDSPSRHQDFQRFAVISVVEMRFFGGMSVEETAELLKVSPETVMRDWRLAEAWLLRELSGEKPDGAGALGTSRTNLSRR